MRVCLTVVFFVVSFKLLLAQVGDSHIMVDQFGYKSNSSKVAVIRKAEAGYNAPDDYVPAGILEVRRATDSSLAYSGDVISKNNGLAYPQAGDKVWWFDFTPLEEEGAFFIYDPQNRIYSHRFFIAENVYNHLLKTAVRTFYYQRCGVPKLAQYGGDWHDENACHVGANQDVACRSISDPENESLELDLSGGWHDAGDFNKYTNWYYDVIPNLLLAYCENPDAFKDDYNIPESGNGIPDILDEVKFGMDYLLKLVQEDGSVITKVSVSLKQSASPPSADTNSRYYGTPVVSNSISMSAVFALGHIVFKEFPIFKDYADTLLAKSLLAMDYVNAHPQYSEYDNEAFITANPEIDAYHQEMRKVAAHIYLFAATGNTAYRDSVDAEYAKLNAIDWYYWYSFEYGLQRDILFYSHLPGASPAVAQAIKNNLRGSLERTEFLEAFVDGKDPYRAYLKEKDYAWGSNSLKSRIGSTYSDAIYYKVNPGRDSLYRAASEAYLHYVHGVNPQGMAYLSNMRFDGAERSANQMYHVWFNDAPYKSALESELGPAPGFMTGGPYYYYTGDSDVFLAGRQYSSPIAAQPVQKRYSDENSIANSWEILENSIAYQAAYIKLLASHANGMEPLEVEAVDIKEEQSSIPAAFYLGNEIQAYPNPVHDMLYLEIDELGIREELTAEVFGLNGSLLKQERLNENRLDVSMLPAGSYLLRLRAEAWIGQVLFVKLN